MSSVKDLLRGDVVDGSGTANYVSKWSDADTITNSVIYDDGTNVGIGTSSPDQLLHVEKNAPGAGVELLVGNSGANQSGTYSQIGLGTGGDSTGTAHLRLYRDGSGISEFKGYNIQTFIVGGSERVRIDSSGNVLINKTSSEAVASVTPANLQVTTTGVGASIVSVANASGPAGILALGHGRGNAAGLLLNNDAIGQIRFAAGDGTDIQTLAAQISVEVDGTAGANDMPSRMVFSTTADGAASPTERMRIASSGAITISGTLTSTADINTSAAISIGSGQISSVAGKRQITRVAGNNGGALIFTTLFTTPQVGFLYVYELNTSNYLVATVFKQSSATLPVYNIISNSVLNIGAMNVQGTMVINGATNGANVRMKAVIEEC
jgi:hypothetical protein